MSFTSPNQVSNKSLAQAPIMISEAILEKKFNEMEKRITALVDQKLKEIEKRIEATKQKVESMEKLIDAKNLGNFLPLPIELLLYTLTQLTSATDVINCLFLNKFFYKTFSKDPVFLPYKLIQKAKCLALKEQNNPDRFIQLSHFVEFNAKYDVEEAKKITSKVDVTKVWDYKYKTKALLKIYLAQPSQENFKILDDYSKQDTNLYSRAKVKLARYKVNPTKSHFESALKALIKTLNANPERYEFLGEFIYEKIGSKLLALQAKHNLKEALSTFEKIFGQVKDVNIHSLARVNFLLENYKISGLKNYLSQAILLLEDKKHFSVVYSHIKAYLNVYEATGDEKYINKVKDYLKNPSRRHGLADTYWKFVIQSEAKHNLKGAMHCYQTYKEKYGWPFSIPAILEQEAKKDLQSALKKADQIKNRTCQIKSYLAIAHSLLEK